MHFSTSPTMFLSYYSHHFQSINLYELLIQYIKSSHFFVSNGHQVLLSSLNVLLLNLDPCTLF